MFDFAAIDFETASGRNAVCAVGVHLQGKNGKVDFETLINPEIPDDEWDEIAMFIHGIRPSDVTSAPNFMSAWNKILEIVNPETIFVAHNASFDMSVLRASFARYEIVPTPMKYICSAKIAKKVWTDIPTTRLEYLAEKLGIEFVHHNALEDAMACAEVLRIALQHYVEKYQEVESLEQFVDSLGLQVGQIMSDLNYIPCGLPSAKNSSVVKHFSSKYEGDPSKQIDPNNPLFEKKVVITGALSSMSRDEAHLRISEIGGVPQKGITKSTDFLVSGEQDLFKLRPGSHVSNKMAAAVELIKNGSSLEIIGEKDLIKFLFTAEH